MVVVILAAGVARRMGRQKLLLPIDGRPMIEHVVRAAAAWSTIVVTSDEVAPAIASMVSAVVRNDRPECGMSHSLGLANAVIPASEPIAVLLADLPDITAQTIAAVCSAFDAAQPEVDVAIARHGETYGHPVVFGPRARQKIAGLAGGDTLARLRDDPSLRRCVVQAGSAALKDIDTPADYFQRVTPHAEPAKSSP